VMGARVSGPDEQLLIRDAWLLQRTRSRAPVSLVHREVRR